MNRQVISALLVAGLLAMTLPLFYLVFTRIILPTLWQEEESDANSAHAIKASPQPEEPATQTGG